MVSLDFILDFQLTETLECRQVNSVNNKSHDNSDEENRQTAIAAKAGAWPCLRLAVSLGRGTADCGRNRQVRNGSSRLDSRRPAERSPARVRAIATHRKGNFFFWPAARSDRGGAPFDGGCPFQSWPRNILGWLVGHGVPVDTKQHRDRFQRGRRLVGNEDSRFSRRPGGRCRGQGGRIRCALVLGSHLLEHMLRLGSRSLPTRASRWRAWSGGYG